MPALKLVTENIEVRVIRHSKKVKESWFKNFVESFKKMNIKNRTKKLILTVFAGYFLFMQSPFVALVAAEETTGTAATAPSAPTAPTPPAEPTPEETPPVAPTAAPAPTAPVAPTAAPAPTYNEATNNDNNQPSAQDLINSFEDGTDNSDNNYGSYTTDNSQQPSSWSPSSGTGSLSSDGGSGSATITTGDANNVGNISTNANSNISLTPTTTAGSGASVINADNGAGSENSGSLSTSSDTLNLQNNSANVGSNLTQRTVTGDNSASMNTNGDNTITTGDANTSGEILTGVNTNLDGVTVYEFNIADNQNGDYVLDLNNATCISGCAPTDLSVVNDGNGAGSTNTGSIDSSNNNDTLQNNDATVENNLNLTSLSGSNKADMNTGGDNTITTGDSNVSGSVVNMVNNNIEGGVVYAVVNIFGDLVGDIILPDGTIMSCCFGSVDAQNSGNGADSTNTADINQSADTNQSQFNNADIENNVYLKAVTGANDTNKNTDGSSEITTGDTNVVAQVMNVANTNINGGSWWLVLVNEAGKWIGKIVGSPDGQNYAGSSGFEFIVDDTGEITAVNSGNGAGSTNSSNVSSSATNNVTQTNDAKIVNNVNLSADTGHNSTNMDTGGNNSIQTGDANVIASIVNFVNNNIIGGGKLFVTVVNVFGSWLGDFVGPGQTQAQENNSSQQSIGGTSDDSDNQDISSQSEDNQASSADTQPVTFQHNKVASNTADSNSSSGVNSISINEEEGNLASGQTENVLGAQATKRVVKINLALLLPVALIYIGYLIRKRRSVQSPAAVRA